MRVFQFDSFYFQYLESFYKKLNGTSDLDFKCLNRRLIDDRFNATHVLEPALNGDSSAVYAIANDRVSQMKWAEENGLRTKDLRDILLAQIEEHRADVLYAMDLDIIDGDFIKRLPGCVKKRICFHGGPGTRFNLSLFDLCLSNFPVYLRRWSREGLRAAYFGPSHDPAMSEYASNEDRPIDIAFVGTCSGYHVKREALLNMMAVLGKQYKLHFALIHPPFRPWVDCRLLRRIPSPFPYLPQPLREVAQPPVFGRALYDLFGKAKIVLNVIDDIHGVHRANMRCFEAMGTGGCMLSDEGVYPPGMIEGEHYVGFSGAAEAVAIALQLLKNPGEARRIGRGGATMLGSFYGKAQQWASFQSHVNGC